MDIIHLVEKFGFPLVAAGCMGYLIFYLYKWTTTEVKSIVSETNTTLIALIDRVRMLDNDLIRLTQKVNVVIQLKQEKKDDTTNQQQKQ
jgi:hypothetical protein